MPNLLEDKLSRLLSATEDNEELEKRGKFSHINPDLVVGLLEFGWSMGYISAIYGCSRCTLTKHMKNHDQDFKARKYFIRHRQDVTDEYLTDLYAQLENCSEISDIVDMGRNAISNRLKKAGIEVKKSYREDLYDNKILSIYRIMRNTAKVARLLNTNRHTIRKRLNKIGVDTSRTIWGTRKKRMDINEEEVLELHKSRGIYKIAKKYHTTPTRIKEILLSNGVPIRAPNSKRTDLPESEVVVDYKTNDLKTISKKYNTSTRVISRILEENNVIMKMGPERKDLPESEIVKGYKTNTIMVLARKYNVSSTTIRRILLENGVKMRKVGTRSPS